MLLFVFLAKSFLLLLDSRSQQKLMMKVVAGTGHLAMLSQRFAIACWISHLEKSFWWSHCACDIDNFVQYCTPSPKWGYWLIDLKGHKTCLLWRRLFKVGTTHSRRQIMMALNDRSAAVSPSLSPSPDAARFKVEWWVRMSPLCVMETPSHWE